MKQHPNMLASGGAGTIGVLVAWALGRFHIAISAEEGAAISLGITTVVLFVGRRGLKNTLLQIWNGPPPPSK